MEIRRNGSRAPRTAAPSADLRANASAAVAALFGASVVAVRVAVRDVPPLSLAVLRFGQGGLLPGGILLAVAPALLRARWERMRLFGLLGGVLFALFPLTFNVGLQFTEASRGALMLATMPIWSALLGRIAGERLAARQVAGVVLSVLGIGLAFAEPGRAFSGGAEALLGDGLLLRRLDLRLIGLVVFLGVLGGAVAFLLWTLALSRLTPTQVALYVNLNPIVAALLGVLLLAERRSGLFLVGFAAVVTGVALVNWPGRRAP